MYRQSLLEGQIVVTPSVQSSQCTSSLENGGDHHNPVMLPPCVICGEKSSGYHYGANTCEACKGFFRRCLNRQTMQPCKYTGNCEISFKRKRNGCPACRYKRCVEAGMSKNAIKIGRHTYEKKTQDIQDVKRLELQDMMNKNGRRPEVDTRHVEMEKIIAKMTTLNWGGKSNSQFEALMKAEQEFLEMKELENTIFGTRRPLSREEYNAIFTATGLDIDGRKAKVENMIPIVHKKVENFIAFSNALPGFSQIPIKDQKLLSRASSLERWIFIFSSWYNLDQFLFTCVDTETLYSMDDVLQITDGDTGIFMNIWNLIGRYQRLELTESEAIITAALSVMNADCNDLSPVARQICLASSDYLIEALAYLIKKNHDQEDGTLGKIIGIMRDLIPLHEYFAGIREQFINDNADMGFPELFIEYLV